MFPRLLVLVFNPQILVMEFACSVGTFCELLVNLTDEQTNVVKSLGFEYILQIKDVQLRASLLKFLLSRYNVQDGTFTIVGKNLKINHVDVYYILGLPFSGQTVKNIKPLPRDNQLVKMYANKYNKILIKDLLQEIQSGKDTGDHFIRMFMLTFLGTILAPTSSEEVPVSYLGLLGDTSQIKNINWNEFTLGFLMDNVKSVVSGHGTSKYGYKKWPCGNLVLLQVSLVRHHIVFPFFP